MTRLFNAALLVSFSLTGVAVAKSKQHKPKSKIEVCLQLPWSQGYHVIKVPKVAATWIVANHPGAQYASAWYVDADNDACGDPSSQSRKCPAAGYVDNDLDCNDSDGAVNPEVAETCGDGVDQNCNLEIDEGCSTGANCQCFTGAELDAIHAEWQAEAWSYGTATCTDNVVSGNYNQTHIAWYGERYGNASANETTQYYSIDYDESGQAYCSRFHRRNDYDSELGVWNESEFEDTFTAISADEDAACRDVIYDFAERSAMTCQ